MERIEEILQNNAYQGWYKLARKGEFKLTLCWLHIRCYFFKCVEFLQWNGGGKSGELELLTEVFDLIKRFFEVEESLDSSSSVKIVRQRQMLSKFLVNSLKELLDTNRPTWEVVSEIAKAMDFMVNK